MQYKTWHFLKNEPLFFLFLVVLMLMLKKQKN